VTGGGAGLALRPARPGDLPQLEAWCHQLRPGERPPFIAATLAEMAEHPGRGTLLIVEDAGAERGFVVIAGLWSNRLRGEVAVIDDWLVDPGLDDDLLLFEAARHARAQGARAVLVRGPDGALAPAADAP